MRGKTIKLYLVDGTPQGLMTAEIMNWSGKVIVAPRTDLAKLGQRDEARRTGAYILVGDDPVVQTKLRAYIGESDNVFARIAGHDKDPANDFCTHVVLLLSKDANLTKAHARYLENRLILMAKASGRAVLANGNDGSSVALPESDIADMEAFLDHVQMILPVLGFDFTQPKVEVDEAATTGSAGASPTLYFSVAGASARAVELDGSFILLKGSTARKEPARSWTSYKALREQLVADGKFAAHAADPSLYVTVEDIPFASPSAAAAVVAARNTNGRQSWKLATGETYQQWFDSRFQEEGPTSPIGPPAQ